MVSLPRANPIQALIERYLSRLPGTQADRPRMNLIGTLIAMVQAGHGHAVVPSLALDECVRHGLTASLLTGPAVDLELYLLSRRGAQVKPAAVYFAAALENAASWLAW